MGRSKFFAVLFICAVLFGSVPPIFAANTFYVKTPANGGNDSNDGTTWGNSFATIVQALKSADFGDRINIAAGTFTENLTVEKSLEIFGGYPAAGGETKNLDSNLTTIDGGGLYVGANGTIIMGKSTFTGNHAVTGSAISEGGRKFPAY